MFDLVQLECAHRRRAVLCVTSGARVGYVFFDAGRIVHATADDLAGESALFEILRWQSGTAVPCERAWPARPSIHEAAPALLLRAAQLADERVRSVPPPPAPAPAPAGELIPFTRPDADEATNPLRRVPRASASPSPEPPPSPQPPKETAVNPSSTPWPTEFALDSARCFDATIVDGDGNVLAGHGHADDLAPIAAYVADLADLIGESLGLDPFSDLQARLDDDRELVVKRLGASVGAALGLPGLLAPQGQRK